LDSSAQLGLRLCRKPGDLALETNKIAPKGDGIFLVFTTATTKIDDGKRLLEKSIDSGIEGNSSINVGKPPNFDSG